MVFTVGEKRKQDVSKCDRSVKEIGMVETVGDEIGGS